MQKGDLLLLSVNPRPSPGNLPSATPIPSLLIVIAFGFLASGVRFINVSPLVGAAVALVLFVGVVWIAAKFRRSSPASLLTIDPPDFATASLIERDIEHLSEEEIVRMISSQQDALQALARILRLHQQVEATAEKLRDLLKKMERDRLSPKRIRPPDERG